MSQPRARIAFEIGQRNYCLQLAWCVLARFIQFGVALVIKYEMPLSCSQTIEVHQQRYATGSVSSSLGF